MFAQVSMLLSTAPAGQNLYAVLKEESLTAGVCRMLAATGEAPSTAPHPCFQKKGGEISLAAVRLRSTDCRNSGRLWLFAAEVEQVPQVADGRRVQRHVRIARRHDRVRVIVAATIRHGLQSPVSLDEFQDRHVIRVV